MSTAKQYTRNFVDDKVAIWQPLFADLVGKPNLRALEIGSFEGRSACWFLDNVLTGAGSVLECVDPFRVTRRAGRYETRFDANTAEYGNRLVKHQSESLPWLCQEHTKGRFGVFDFIYVDGDHRCEQALLDFCMSWPFLKRGGILLIDDYPYKPPPGCPPLSLAWDTFVACAPPGLTPILTEGWQRAVVKQ